MWYMILFFDAFFLDTWGDFEASERIKTHFLPISGEFCVAMEVCAALFWCYAANDRYIFDLANFCWFLTVNILLNNWMTLHNIAICYVNKFFRTFAPKKWNGDSKGIEKYYRKFVMFSPEKTWQIRAFIV